MESKHDRSPLPTGQQSGPTEMAVFWWLTAVGAIVTSVSAGYIAHYEFGYSRYEIRTPAVIGAAIIGLLMATEYFVQSPGVGLCPLPSVGQPQPGTPLAGCATAAQ